MIAAFPQTTSKNSSANLLAGTTLGTVPGHHLGHRSRAPLWAPSVGTVPGHHCGHHLWAPSWAPSVSIIVGTIRGSPRPSCRPLRILRGGARVSELGKTSRSTFRDPSLAKGFVWHCSNTLGVARHSYAALRCAGGPLESEINAKCNSSEAWLVHRRRPETNTEK